MGSIRKVRSARALGQWCIGVMLLCAVLRALVPVGFMPQFPTEDGGFPKLVICTAKGVKSIAAEGSEDSPDPVQHPDHSEPPCAFSGLAAYAFLVSPLAVKEPVQFAEPVCWPRSTTVCPPVRAGPSHAIRGPPSIV